MAFEWGVLRRAGEIDGWHEPLSARAARGGFWACVAVVLSGPIRLYVQARSLAGPDEPVWPMAMNVLGVRWGGALIAQFVLAAIGAAAFSHAVRRRTSVGMGALAIVLVLCFTPGLTGHASGVTHARPLAIFADWLHVAAAGAWVGALVFLAGAVAGLSNAPHGGTRFASLVDAFHPLALISASTLLVTGVISLWLRVARFQMLLGSPYGAILFAKLACVAAVTVLGAFHARQAAARVRQAGARSMARSLYAEVVFAALTIAATALLTGTAQPGE